MMSTGANKETGANDTHRDYERVCARIRSYEGALIAFSGGVDSSVVAALARRALGDATVAVTVNTGVLHYREVDQATAIAKTIGIRHRSISVEPLTISEIAHNDPERCYYCKQFIFGALCDLAEELCLNAVMDGTNASDFAGHRPGTKALRELGIVSPLYDIAKDDVRSLARSLGLPNADAPSAACLLTSLPYATTVTRERVERLRNAEQAVMALGIAKVKVRDHNGFARIEVDQEDADKVIAHSANIAEAFSRLGFAYVALDLEWFRSGSMDIALNRAGTTGRNHKSEIPRCESEWAGLQKPKLLR